MTILTRSTHSQRLETWLGVDGVKQISDAMRGYHADIAIPVANVPGRVYVTRDGDFVGGIKGGYYGDLWGLMQDRARRALRKTVLHAGFSSVGDLLSELTTGGKKQSFVMNKLSGAGVTGTARHLWNVAANPPAGGVATAAAAGHSPTNATDGSLKQVNPSGGDTLHFLGGVVSADVVGRTLLMYDRFYAVNHTMTVDPQTVSGTPTRYQSTAAKGNFISMCVTTVLPAATPTYEVTYVDQDGNAAEAAAVQTIVSAAAVGNFPFAATVGSGWFIPLNAADTGVRSITNLNLSAAMASGACDVILGKPVAFLPTSLATAVPVVVDGVNSPMFIEAIADNACLAFLDINRSSSGTTNFHAWLHFCAG